MAGKPLIAWTVVAALESGIFADVICSTDDDEIANAARNAGASVPFMRPSELASDTATSFDVVMHALKLMPSEYDWVCLLQPTSPLRTAEDLQSAFQIATHHACPAVVSVCESAVHPYHCFQVTQSGAMEGFFPAELRGQRRQDMPPSFTLNGAIYFIKPSALAESKSFVPPGTMAYVMPVERSIDIDDADDFHQAERFLLNL